MVFPEDDTLLSTVIPHARFMAQQNKGFVEGCVPGLKPVSRRVDPSDYINPTPDELDASCNAQTGLLQVRGVVPAHTEHTVSGSLAE